MKSHLIQILERGYLETKNGIKIESTKFFESIYFLARFVMSYFSFKESLLKTSYYLNHITPYYCCITTINMLSIRAAAHTLGVTPATLRIFTNYKIYIFLKLC